MDQKFNKFKFYYFLYVTLIFIFAVFYLYQKHLVGNDSTISEWLINYQGGFTRRGLIGEICFQIADFFNLNLRFTIFIFQVIMYLVYSTLIYIFIKDLPKNLLSIIAIFSPIFLLYPINEIEVLARKEIFIFIGFIIFLILSNPKFSKNTPLIYIFFTFPILILIWEPVIFFYFFPAYIIVINNIEDSIKKVFLKIILTFSSSVLAFFLIIFNLLSPEEHLLMKEALMNNFAEHCSQSCGLLGTKSSIADQFNAVTAIFSFKILFRYLLIILIGFAPLIILFFRSKLKNDIRLLDSKNLLLTLIILLAPVLILFASATDWGRWVNISYTFSILLYFYLLKNDKIFIDQKIFYFDDFYKKRKKLFIVLFFIFSFGWNPKTSMKGDIASNSLYKLLYNTSKKIFKFDGIRLFQDSTIIKFHKKYFE